MKANVTIEVSKEDIKEFILSKFPEYKKYSIDNIYHDKNGWDIQLKKSDGSEPEHKPDETSEEEYESEETETKEERGWEVKESELSKINEKSVMESVEKGEKTIKEVVKDILGTGCDTGSPLYARTILVLNSLHYNGVLSYRREKRKVNKTRCRVNVYGIMDEEKEKKILTEKIFNVLKRQGKQTINWILIELEDYYGHQIRGKLKERLDELVKDGQLETKKDDEDVYYMLPTDKPEEEKKVKRPKENNITDEAVMNAIERGSERPLDIIRFMYPDVNKPGQNYYKPLNDVLEKLIKENKIRKESYMGSGGERYKYFIVQEAEITEAEESETEEKEVPRHGPERKYPTPTKDQITEKLKEGPSSLTALVQRIYPDMPYQYAMQSPVTKETRELLKELIDENEKVGVKDMVNQYGREYKQYYLVGFTDQIKVEHPHKEGKITIEYAEAEIPKILLEGSKRLGEIAEMINGEPLDPNSTEYRNIYNAVMRLKKKGFINDRMGDNGREYYLEGIDQEYEE